MPAPFQGAYKSSTNLRQSAFDKHFISPLKGEVAASFCEQTEGLQYINCDTICTSQQILDTNHKKIYNKKLSVSQISVRNATCDIELASDSLTNKLDAVH